MVGTKGTTVPGLIQVLSTVLKPWLSKGNLLSQLVLTKIKYCGSSDEDEKLQLGRKYLWTPFLIKSFYIARCGVTCVGFQHLGACGTRVASSRQPKLHSKIWSSLDYVVRHAEMLAQNKTKQQQTFERGISKRYQEMIWLIKAAGSFLLWTPQAIKL